MKPGMSGEDETLDGRAELELAKTVLADSAGHGAIPGPSGDDSRFELATGEPDLIPVSLETDAEQLPAERYERGVLLGAGGMGEVRLCKDARIGRHVAMKTLRSGSGDAETERRFLREARIQGQLEHPAIVPVYDVDTDSTRETFFTMKRVRGQTLHRVLDQLAKGDADAIERYGRRRLLTAFTQVCHAVHYAHVRGVVHRDLKPGNIMLGDFGEVYVLDWGIARLMRDAPVEPSLGAPIVLDTASALTRDGDLVGSMGYMAPEQMQGASTRVDARADVFALGVVLFELLTGKRFRELASLPVMVERALKGEKQRPRDVDANVPPELDVLTARCTARDPASRVQSTGELAHAIERYLEGDRDQEARRTLAAEQLASARQRLAENGSHAEGRIEALREVVRALALDPDSTEAQALLVEGLVEIQGPAPAEAEAEVREQVAHLRRVGARRGAMGYGMMLLTGPMAFWLGIKNPMGLFALTAVTASAAVLSFVASRRDATPGYAHTLALLAAAQVVAASALTGPFVLVPVLAASVALFFAAHVTPNERRVALVLITLAAVLPFGLGATGAYGATFAFEPGRMVVFANAVDFPAAPSLIVLIYASVTFVVLPSLFVGMMRDELVGMQRRLLLQSWQLRRLFPGARSGTHASVATSDVSREGSLSTRSK